MRDVSYAVLHTLVFIPGIGNFGPTLTADPNNGRLKQVKMQLDSSGTLLHVTLQNKTTAVPLSNVAYMVFSATAAAKEEAKAK